MFFSVQNLPDIQDSKYLVLRMSFPHAFSGNDMPYIYVLEIPLVGLILEMTKSGTDTTNMEMLII